MIQFLTTSPAYLIFNLVLPIMLPGITRHPLSYVPFEKKVVIYILKFYLSLTEIDCTDCTMTVIEETIQKLKKS